MATATTDHKDPIFLDLNADTTEGPTEIESYCMNCEQNVSLVHSYLSYRVKPHRIFHS